MRLPPPVDVCEWTTITRCRFGYAIDVRTELSSLNEPYWRPTRRWAEAKARKLLRPKPQRESWTVTR